MPVIGAAVAVLVHRPPELRHRQDHGVRHAIAEVGDERRDAAAEIVEAVGELALGGALVHVRVPAADVGERDLEADVRPCVSCAICRSAWPNGLRG